MKKALGVSVPLLFLAACASNPAPSVPAPLNPVGYFEFATDIEGESVTGSLEIRQAEGGGYTGTLTASAAPEPLPIRSVTVEGQTLTVVADTPDGPVTAVLTFTGDTFTGPWSYAGMSGTMAGKRIR